MNYNIDIYVILLFEPVLIEHKYCGEALAFSNRYNEDVFTS